MFRSKIKWGIVYSLAQKNFGIHASKSPQLIK